MEKGWFLKTPLFTNKNFHKKQNNQLVDKIIKNHKIFDKSKKFNFEFEFKAKKENFKLSNKFKNNNKLKKYKIKCKFNIKKLKM